MPSPAATAQPEFQADSLEKSIAELARRYRPTPPITDPLALIVWENVGYLISDDRRQVLFEELAQQVGLTAARLAEASENILFDIARRGGMRPVERAERLRHIGRLALEAGVDFATAIRSMGPAEARRVLKRFPGIADPGADKILLFSGVEARPALDSNGVRAMVRLGYAAEGSSYAHAYRSATTALVTPGLPDRDRLMQAFQVLRAHGQTLCKRSAPLCLPCPLDSVCAHTTTKSL